MAISDNKITNAEIAEVHVQAAPDTLTGSAQQNKAVFDAYSDLIKEKHNSLIDDIDGEYASNWRNGSQTGSVRTTGSEEEGDNYTIGLYAAAEGRQTKASGSNSHAEGFRTQASKYSSHAEGHLTNADGNEAHAEGRETLASGNNSHAEGQFTNATGDNSHAEGNSAEASGNNSHAEGYGTIASSSDQHVSGRYNIEDTNNIYAEIIGNGTSLGRGNGRTLDWNGNEVLAGKLTVGTEPENNKDVATKGYVDTGLDGKVEKVTGKGLSTEDYTTAEKTKLSGIEAGAEANVQADWNKSDSNADDYIKNKPPIKKGTGTDSIIENDTNNIASGDLSHAEGTTTSATGIGSHTEGYLTKAAESYTHANGVGTEAHGYAETVIGQYNDYDAMNEPYAFVIGNGNEDGDRSNAHTTDWQGNAWYAGEVTDGTGNVLSEKVDKEAGKGLSTNDYTTAEKMKLSGIEAGAEANVQTDWNQSDSSADDYLKNKPYVPSVDSTLSTSGAAADAKKVGDEITGLKSEIGEIAEDVITSTNILNPSVYFTGAIGSDGNLMTNGVYANYKTSDFIELEENTDYYFAVYSTVGDASTQRKLLLLYDASKEPISGTHQNDDTQTQLTFNTSTNVKYVRVSTSVPAGYKYLQVAKGTTAGTYTPYTERKDLLINLGDVPKAQVQDIINNSGIITYEAGKNLANPDTMTVGAIQSNGTVATNGAWGAYKTTDYIEIEPSTSFVASQWSDQGLLATGRMLLLLFDESKTLISGTYQNTDAVTYLTFSNASAKYVRVSGRNYMIFQVEKGSAPTTYEAYSGKSVLGYPLGRVPMAQAQSDNPLYKKKWAVCGDSFTNGATENRLTEGKYKGQRIVYPYIIGNRNEMDIVKFFEGGRTLAYPSDGTFHNSLTDPAQSFYYQNIPSDADYITIYLGINDGNHSGSGTTPDGEDATGVITLGTIDDNTTATYFGAWNVVLSWLIENRPFAHIGIIVSNGCRNSDWRDAQIAIAEKYGLPYIDLNGDARTPAMIRSQNPKIASAVKTIINQKQAVSYPSNTHPNDDAHLFESTFIESFLKSI